MEFKVQRRAQLNIDKFQEQDRLIAYKFAKHIHKELGGMLKAVILFGTTTSRTGKKPGDVDILLILDDLTVQLTPEIIQTYRIITEKVINQVSNRLHITSLKFTTFWEYVRVGDPVAINILRSGVALIDSGFFDPLQALLFQGRIRSSIESVWSHYTRATTTLYNSKWHVLQATLDLYWSVIDSAQAVIMKIGEMPPSPAHIAKVMNEKLVKTRLLEKRYANTMKEFYELSKKIMHGELKQVSGRDYDRYFKKSQDFVIRMKKIIE